MKSYTDIEQSRKLAEILPIESADMFYTTNSNCEGKIIGLLDVPLYIGSDGFVDTEMGEIYAWSLAALLGVLPDEITDDGDVYRNMFFHLKGRYIIQYPRLTTLWPSLLSVEADNPVDACVSMIEKLHEHKML